MGQSQTAKQTYVRNFKNNSVYFPLQIEIICKKARQCLKNKDD